MILTSAAAIDPAPPVMAALSSGCRVVTFDVFDTLLWRKTLFPEDVFLLLTESHCRFWAYVRNRAEALATVYCRAMLGREPRLGDVYRLLPLNPTTEFQIERQLCVANPFCLSLVNQLIEHQIPIAAVSDMYLESEQIAGLLTEAGYPDMIVLSSATEGISKHRGGKLLQRAWERLGASPADAVHIGDHPRADIDAAQHLGAQACAIMTPRSTLFNLLPPLRRPMRTSAESLCWGQMALSLHVDGLNSADIKARLEVIVAHADLATRTAVHALLCKVDYPT